MKVRRALLSVHDKTGIVELATGLVELGVELLSTGGTARLLREAGLPVREVADVTGFPELLDGRVKTLHPGIHGGILARRDRPEDLAALDRHSIPLIDLVVVTLYPFEATVARPDVTLAEAVEQIDIGGPAMIRSGAKNAAWVTVVTAPGQYDAVVAELNEHDGCTTLALRARLAAAAFARTAEYDASIASYLSRRSPEAFPPVLRLSYPKAADLRYGENPHQRAALYRDPASTGQTIVAAEQLHGRPLSYNNINDAAAALEVAKSLRQLAPDRAGACVVKHMNPCGASIAPTPDAAVDQAIAGDPLAAFGGILALNVPVSAPAAERIARPECFVEVVVAPSFEPPALEILRARWSQVRLLAVGQRTPSGARKLDYRSIPGGMLVQERDSGTPDPARWTHAAGPAPTPDQLRAAAFVECVVRYLSSNAVAIGGMPSDPPGADALRLFGAGGGHVDRLTACRIAVEKAAALARGAVAASDAFFPFPDGPRVLIDAGVRVIVHPGGSKRDQETLALCEQHAVTCLLTGVRHFRH